MKNKLCSVEKGRVFRQESTTTSINNTEIITSKIITISKEVMSNHDPEERGQRANWGRRRQRGGRGGGGNRNQRNQNQIGGFFKSSKNTIIDHFLFQHIFQPMSQEEQARFIGIDRRSNAFGGGGRGGQRGGRRGARSDRDISKARCSNLKITNSICCFFLQKNSALSQILRHKALDLGLKVRPDGYCVLSNS